MIIDISYYNPIKDWDLVKNAVDGIIIRMGYSGYASGKCVLDNKWRLYSAAALEKGIPRGAYFFPQSVNITEAEREADFIYNELKDCSLPLGIWLDSEIADTKNKSGRADKLNKATRTQMLLIIIKKLRTYGLTCGIYASASWFISNLDMSKLQDVPLWVAQWNSTLTFKYPAQLWQYSDNGSIPGIIGRVDLDKFVKEEKVPDPELDAAVDVIACRVIKGDFGYGHDNRMLKIYELIRLRVNDILK
ncbi:GH25 family lysozyme [Ruminococcus sp.]|uniref:GH25 family lysozyme n=1 Tax=Ruminococcus sp. TaxID=41978 RepID=UPI001B6536BF|nr:GH25 family lysozyme [Ruminococcus sp.]MBP5430874.1 hypothetical protein [Ruminococcus sp.]